jgi:hypothetical protein
MIRPRQCSKFIAKPFGRLPIAGVGQHARNGQKHAVRRRRDWVEHLRNPKLDATRRV